jgi:TonB family protein
MFFLSIASCLLSFFLSFQSAHNQWKEHRSEEGKFTVLLPGEPTTAYRPVDYDSRIFINHITYVHTTVATYSLAFFDIPEIEPGKVKQLLNNTRDSIIKLYSLKLQDEVEISGQYDGRSLIMKSPGGKQFFSRIYLVKQRVYQLSVILPQNQKDLSDVNRFYDSFRPIPLTGEEIKNLESNYKAESGKLKPGLKRNSNSVLLDIATRKVLPSYPNSAKLLNVTGTVLIRVLISENGQVIETEIIDGPPMLLETSLEAAKKWRFKPMLIGGTAVKIDGVLTFNFELK